MQSRWSLKDQVQGTWFPSWEKTSLAGVLSSRTRVGRRLDLRADKVRKSHECSKTWPPSWKCWSFPEFRFLPGVLLLLPPFWCPQCKGSILATSHQESGMSWSNHDYLEVSSGLPHVSSPLQSLGFNVKNLNTAQCPRCQLGIALNRASSDQSQIVGFVVWFTKRFVLMCSSQSKEEKN